MRVFVYCRVSTEEQARGDHYSLEFQEQMARQRIRERGWELFKVRKDVGSGKSGDSREGYQELLTDIQSGAIDAVAVYKLDRLSRNVSDVYHFIEVTKKHEVGFISLMENFDTTTAMGRAMLGVAAVFSQLTREAIVENIKSGLKHRASTGKWAGGHLAPFGYTYVNREGLVINPDEAPIVRRLFELYVNRKKSTRQITLLLNEEGVPRREGGQWSRNLVSRILRNPAYTGQLRYDGVVSQGQHEPLIDVGTFEAAQKLIDSRLFAAGPPRSHTSDYLLSGLIRCEYCGWRMHGHQLLARHKYYRCVGNLKVGKESCSGVLRATDVVEHLVVQQIKSLAGSEQVRQLALAEVQTTLQRDMAPQADERQRLDKELQKTKEAFNRWADQLDAGLIDDDEFRDRIGKLRERRQAVERRLAELEAAVVEQEQVKVEFEKVQGVLKDFDRLWEQGTPEERKELVRAVAERVTVGKETMVVKLRFLPEVTVELPERRGRGRPRKVAG